LTHLKYWIFCKQPIPLAADLVITAKPEGPTAKFNYKGKLHNGILEM
jgi:hypothetical protein